MTADDIAPDPDVVDTELDGDETVLLHLGTKHYFTLNATGGVIWRAIKARRPRDEIVRDLVQRYDISPALVKERLVSRAVGS
jgi:hypothetical protein